MEISATAGFSPLTKQKLRDYEKGKLAAENGINFLIIPYWWDNQQDSLSVTLWKYFPSIVDQRNIWEFMQAEPIPETKFH